MRLALFVSLSFSVPDSSHPVYFTLIYRHINESTVQPRANSLFGRIR